LTGYDGRVTIQTIEKKNFLISKLKNYISFRAHDIARGNSHQNLYQINDCGFVQTNNHYQINSFYTCGGNGDLSIWELNKREKIKNIPANGKETIVF
jgi:hypothetical protein